MSDLHRFVARVSVFLTVPSFQEAFCIDGSKNPRITIISPHSISKQYNALKGTRIPPILSYRANDLNFEKASSSVAFLIFISNAASMQRPYHKLTAKAHGLLSLLSTTIHLTIHLSLILIILLTGSRLVKPQGIHHETKLRFAYGSTSRYCDTPLYLLREQSNTILPPHQASTRICSTSAHKPIVIGLTVLLPHRFAYPRSMFAYPTKQATRVVYTYTQAQRTGRHGAGHVSTTLTLDL